MAKCCIIEFDFRIEGEMRVIAGRARGTKLFTLEGLGTRPTLDRLKEVMFSIIQYELRNKRVLDAFAGSGALGIEALSRGALRADFCEKDSEAFEVLKKNLAKTKFLDSAALYRQDVTDFLKKASGSYDVVFLDPPYTQGLVPLTLSILLERRLLSRGGLVVVESERDLDLSSFTDRLRLRKKKDYSNCSLHFFDDGV